MKEKIKLENEIKNFKINRAELETRNNSLSQQLNKYTNDLYKLNLDKEVLDFEKNTFFKVNFMLNTGKNFDNLDINKKKAAKEIKKISMNNLSLPTTTGNSSSSFSSKLAFKGNSQKTSMDVNTRKDTPIIENLVFKSNLFLNIFYHILIYISEERQFCRYYNKLRKAKAYFKY